MVSADFLASEFINTNEIPPLLEAARDRGALILPLIIGPSLFLRTTSIAHFQTVNDPNQPLISLPEGAQEDIFVRVAGLILDKAPSVPAQHSVVSSEEDFFKPATWTELVRIGDWIIDEEKRTITGSRSNAFLLSREDYGEAPFAIDTELHFSNFPTSKLKMNAGIIFGWQSEGSSYRYFNILITGDELLIERVGFKEARSAEHITDPVPLKITNQSFYTFEARIYPGKVAIAVDQKLLLTAERPVGSVGRVGLRPWRSNLRCTRFVVAPL